jgi:hypothetical protein
MSRPPAGTTCGYCYRPAVATLYLRRTVVEILARRRARTRNVCSTHVTKPISEGLI